MLRLKNIKKDYVMADTTVKALKGINISFRKNEFVSILGQSGCGKTTVLSLIAGLITPTDGEILINGKEEIKEENKLGYMLQKDHLFPWRTIEKNVYLPLEIKKINNESNKKYAQELLDKYGLNLFKKKYPDQLSGGMRQRTALIRTLVSKPQILLLDEPFSALDYQTRLSVCEDVYSIIKAEKKTSILVTHDISEAISMSDKIIVLSARPAKVKSIFETNFTESSPLRRRESKNFGVFFEKIWKELN